MGFPSTLASSLSGSLLSMRALIDNLQPKRFAALLVLAYLAAALPILVLYQPPRLDEDYFSESAYNLATEGRLVSHFVAGMEDGIFWQPPLYFIALAPVIKLFGYSITTVRGFAVFVACIDLLLVYFLGRMVLGEAHARTWMLLAAVNPLYVMYSKMGRMDTLCLFFMLLTIVLVLRASSHHSTGGWFAAGLTAGGAAISHPFGAIITVSVVLWLVLWGKDLAVRRASAVIPFLAPTIVMIAIWFAWGAMHADTFADQLNYQLTRKESGFLDAPVNFLLNFKYVPAAAVVYGFAVIGSYRVVVHPSETRPAVGLVGLLCLISCGVIPFVFESPYQVYIFPVAYVMAALLIFDAPRSLVKFARPTAIILPILHIWEQSTSECVGKPAPGETMRNL
jgi:4-amino-4-deoxy-L-arabinose transferase-like glycosyltransferase